MVKSPERSFEGYTTKYFHISPASVKLFDKLKAALDNKKKGVTRSALSKFIMLEEKLPILVIFSICGGRNSNVMFPNAYNVATKRLAKKYHSDMTKSKIVMKAIRAVGGSLSHHENHIKQIGSNKVVNRSAWKSKACKSVNSVLSGGMIKMNGSIRKIVKKSRSELVKKGAAAIKAKKALSKRVKKVVAAKKKMDAKRRAEMIKKQKMALKKSKKVAMLAAKLRAAKIRADRKRARGLLRLARFVKAQRKAVVKLARLIKKKKLAMNRQDKKAAIKISKDIKVAQAAERKARANAKKEKANLKK